jgi:hypothetical protein
MVTLGNCLFTGATTDVSFNVKSTCWPGGPKLPLDVAPIAVQPVTMVIGDGREAHIAQPRVG